MTTAELMTRAQHAIKTNQPRLAQLYMRKALEQTDQLRRELDPQAYAFRQLSRNLQDFADGLERLGRTFVDVLASNFKPFAQALGGIDQ